MSKTIIKKINNIEEIEIVKKIEDHNKKEVTPIKIYDFLEFNQTNSNKKDSETINKIIDKEQENYENNIYYLYNTLLKINSKKELNSLFKEEIKLLKGNKLEQEEKKKLLGKITKLYENNPDYTLNLFSIEVIKEYYKIITKMFNIDTICIMKSYSLTKDSHKIMNYSGIEFSDKEKEKPIYKFSKEVFETKVSNRYYESDKHLCWYCNTRIIDCPKILDERKKDIIDYDFIQDGEQVYNDLGKLERFTVKRCLKYKK